MLIFLERRTKYEHRATHRMIPAFTSLSRVYNGYTSYLISPLIAHPIRPYDKYLYRLHSDQNTHLFSLVVFGNVEYFQCTASSNFSFHFQLFSTFVVQLVVLFVLIRLRWLSKLDFNFVPTFLNIIIVGSLVFSGCSRLIVQLDSSTVWMNYSLISCFTFDVARNTSTWTLYSSNQKLSVTNFYSEYQWALQDFPGDFSRLLNWWRMIRSVACHLFSTAPTTAGKPQFLFLLDFLFTS